MKILYGVVGEGMGHAMRSRVVLERLVAAGHEIHVMASGRAARLPGGALLRRHGASTAFTYHLRGEPGPPRQDPVVQRRGGVPRPCRAIVEAYFGLITRLPARGGDQRLRILDLGLRQAPQPSRSSRSTTSRSSPAARTLRRSAGGTRPSFRLTRAFVRSQAPGLRPLPRHHLLLPGDRKKPRTTLIPPILRPEILAARPRRGEHLLVYQTAEG